MCVCVRACVCVCARVYELVWYSFRHGTFYIKRIRFTYVLMLSSFGGNKRIGGTGNISSVGIGFSKLFIVHFTFTFSNGNIWDNLYIKMSTESLIFLSDLAFSVICLTCVLYCWTFMWTSWHTWFVSHWSRLYFRIRLICLMNVLFVCFNSFISYTNKWYPRVSNMLLMRGYISSIWQKYILLKLNYLDTSDCYVFVNWKGIY